MNGFDESKINRVTAGAAGGQFAPKSNSAPASSLLEQPEELPVPEGLEDALRDLHPGVYAVTAEPDEDGADTVRVEVQIGGENFLWDADDAPGQAPVIGGTRIVGAEAREELLDKHHQLVQGIFSREYGVEINTDNGEGWSAADLVMSVSIPRDRYDDDAAASTDVHDALAKYVNETDPGTFGSPYVMNRVWTEIEKAEQYGRQDGNGNWLRHRPTSDDPFWRDAAERALLDAAETTALDQHLEDPQTQEAIAGGQTTNRTIADAIQPGVIEMAVQREAQQKTVEAKLGAEIGFRFHPALNGNVVSSRGSVPGRDGYTFESITDGKRTKHRVGTGDYDSAEEIPARYRKAREAAKGFEQHKAELGEVLTSNTEVRRRWERWHRFDTAQ